MQLKHFFTYSTDGTAFDNPSYTEATEGYKRGKPPAYTPRDENSDWSPAITVAPVDFVEPEKDGDDQDGTVRTNSVKNMTLRFSKAQDLFLPF